MRRKLSEEEKAYKKCEKRKMDETCSSSTGTDSEAGACVVKILDTPEMNAVKEKV